MRYERMSKKYTPEMVSFIKSLDGKPIKEQVRLFNDRFNLNLNVPNYSFARKWLGLVKQTGAVGKIGNLNRWKQVHPIGTERLDKDGYVLVRVANPRIEKYKHKLVWEKERGKYNSKTHCLLFLDGNRQNCDIGNLYLIERKYLGPINHFLKIAQLEKKAKLCGIEAIKLYVDAKELEQRQKFKTHKACKEKQPEKNRIMFEMSKNGMTARQIGDCFGIDEVTVRTTIRNTKLRKE